jgi:hypothetical protein
MKILRGCLAVLVLSGCAVSHEAFYAPVDKEYLYDGKACGFVPFAYTLLPLDVVRAQISTAPIDGKIGMSILLPLQNGQSVQFESAFLEIELRDPTRRVRASIPPFEVPVLAKQGERSSTEKVDATAGLRGRSRVYVPEQWKDKNLKPSELAQITMDLFRTHIVIDAPAQDRIVLHFPAALVNGKRVVTEAITLTKVEKTGVATCIQ